MRSIKWKLIAMYLGLVLIVMIVSGTYILLSLRNIEIDKSRAQLESYAEKINEQVVESVGEENFQAELMKTVTNAVGIQGNILDANGHCVHNRAEGALSDLYGPGDYCRHERYDVFFLRKTQHGFPRPAEGMDELCHAGTGR